jgi:two-component system, NarL family, nitrate/nitrite response regulator NarL
VTENHPLRVLLVGEDSLARSGLALLLAKEPGIAVVAERAERAAGADLAAEMAAAGAAVALWDLGPDPDAQLETLALAARESGAPILALLEPGSSERTSLAIAEGARGVLARNASPARIAAALVAIANGLLVLDQVLDQAPAMSSAFGPHAVRQAELLAEPLTPREHEVLRLLAEGLATKQIAGRLGMSEHTAKSHVNAILGKLGAESRTEAVVRAARLGLIAI